jgi:hypothetical protein
MATDLESFEEFLRQQRAAGDKDRSPEEMLRLWRDSQTGDIGSEGATVPDETAYQRLKRKGFIGSIKGGPPDLSENPEYMEGFGVS